MAASPSLSTGVDISAPHFDKVYLFAKSHASTAGDLLQAISRVRTVKEINFHVSKRLNSEEENWEQSLKDLIKFTFNAPGGTIPAILKGKDIWASNYYEADLDF